MTTKSVQLAHQIWPKLIQLAHQRQTITYQDLGAPLGITGQALQNFDRILAPIKYYCRQNNLPPLSALVVRKNTGLPGSGAEADENDLQAVFAYNWQVEHPSTPSITDLAAAIGR